MRSSLRKNAYLLPTCKRIRVDDIPAELRHVGKTSTHGKVVTTQITVGFKSTHGSFKRMGTETHSVGRIDKGVQRQPQPKLQLTSSVLMVLQDRKGSR